MPAGDGRVPEWPIYGRRFPPCLPPARAPVWEMSPPWEALRAARLTDAPADRAWGFGGFLPPGVEVARAVCICGNAALGDLGDTHDVTADELPVASLARFGPVWWHFGDIEVAEFWAGACPACGRMLWMLPDVQGLAALHNAALAKSKRRPT